MCFLRTPGNEAKLDVDHIIPKNTIYYALTKTGDEYDNTVEFSFNNRKRREDM